MGLFKKPTDAEIRKIQADCMRRKGHTESADAFERSGISMDPNMLEYLDDNDGDGWWKVNGRTL